MLWAPWAASSANNWQDAITPVGVPTGVIFLSLAAQEEQSQSTGAGMRTDDSAHIIGEHVLDTIFFLQNGFQSPDILNAVAMADKHRVIGTGQAGLAHLLGQSL